MNHFTRERILELLADDEMTIPQICEKTQIGKGFVIPCVIGLHMEQQLQCRVDDEGMCWYRHAK